MSLTQSNTNEQIKITNFDFLLGFFVILAMDEHFTYYLNWWYVEYFKEIPALKSTYAVHFQMLGKNLVTDYVNTKLGIFFIPWVSQIYLALSSFKLASKDAHILNKDIFSRVKIYLIIILVFTIENFIVAQDFGQAISIYPIVIWMVVLTIMTVLYARFGIKGIVVLAIISLCRWILPIDLLSDTFQALVVTKIHPSFEYDARIEYFLTSGTIGFLLGYVYYHLPQIRVRSFIFATALGILFVTAFHLLGESFNPTPSDALANEHDLAKSFYGSVYIWGMCLITISGFVFLELKKIQIKVPIVNWVGEHSLTVFGTHRIFFLKVIMPISLFVGAIFGRTITANTLEVFIYIFSSIGLSYLTYKFKLYRIIFPLKL